MMKKDFEYDLAISFAEEDRAIASGVSLALDLYKIKHYYYPKQQAKTNGLDIDSTLSEVYEKKSQYVLVIASTNYVKKKFTSIEYKAITKRRKKQKDYMVLVKADGIDLLQDDFFNSKGENLIYFEWEKEFKPLVQGILLEKLNFQIKNQFKDPKGEKSQIQAAKTIVNSKNINNSTIIIK